jgi:dGTPase
MSAPIAGATSPGLAPWALDARASRGRRYPQEPDDGRDAFQRDRDRIVHSSAFRRLVYKTQVFLNHEGDLFRTRLTHSLEVAQLARSIARGLGLNETLCEAIALAHDLGHTPFGHAGQDALDACVRAAAPDSSGFEHNFQSLRVVDALEQRYPAFDGLNLSFEAREGILKHCSLKRAQEIEAHEPNGVARRFLDRRPASLEAQVCNLADEIAYNAHDIDDGLRSGLLTPQQMEELPLLASYHRAVQAEYPGLPFRRSLYEVLRRMISDQVRDVIAASRARLDEVRPLSPDQARDAGRLIQRSAVLEAQTREVKSFLFQRLYRHPKVMETTVAAKQVVAELFAVYIQAPHEMPPEHAGREPRLQAVVDYLAGMTDRYACQAHARLVGGELTRRWLMVGQA